MYDVRNEIVDNYAYFCGVCAYLEEINVKLAHRHLRECTIRVEDVFFCNLCSKMFRKVYDAVVWCEFWWRK